MLVPVHLLVVGVHPPTRRSCTAMAAGHQRRPLSSPVRHRGNSASRGRVAARGGPRELPPRGREVRALSAVWQPAALSGLAPRPFWSSWCVNAAPQQKHFCQVLQSIRFGMIRYKLNPTNLQAKCIAIGSILLMHGSNAITRADLPLFRDRFPQHWTLFST